MAGRYHPLYDPVWDDDAFDAVGDLPRAAFEEVAFFVFLFGNRRQRPSGIYRATDEQLSTDSRLVLARVRIYLRRLEVRQRIVRDNAWLFVRGYYNRQPKGPNMVAAVREDLVACSSGKILRAFYERYPLFAQPLPNGSGTVKGNEPGLTASVAVAVTDAVAVAVTQPVAVAEKGRPVVLTDDQFLASLKLNPAYQGIDIDRELGKLDAWLLTPRGRGKQKSRQRIVNWLNRADRPLESSAGAPAGPVSPILQGLKNWGARHTHGHQSGAVSDRDGEAPRRLPAARSE